MYLNFSKVCAYSQIIPSLGPPYRTHTVLGTQVAQLCHLYETIPFIHHITIEF